MKKTPSGALLSAALATLSWFQAQAAVFTVVNKSDSGAGSLRQAILNANATPGPDRIHFAITGATPFNIQPASALPAITDSVVLDGTTQPGFSGEPLVGLVGSNAGAAHGLVIQAADCEVRALAINRFRGSGLHIQGGSNVVAGCFLGTSLAGTARLGNTVAGVAIAGGAANRIGGTNVADRNLISGNQTGVYIVGFGASNNVVLGNFIGTDVNGTGVLGNTNNGVLVSAPGNLIGGTAAAARNIISGNGQSGVYLHELGAVGNRVCGNFIGTRVNGLALLENDVDGVTIVQARENVIGGTEPGAGNIISGNHERGVFISGANAIANRVQGNFIGVDATGRAALRNRFTGVGIAAASFNEIGGTNLAARNVISGNLQSGVAIDGGAVANVVRGNLIGLDMTGTNALANAFSGISVSGGTNNLIGGPEPGARNVISGNTQSGVLLTGGRETRVEGNWIGTDISGSAGRGNLPAGVRLDSAGNRIGGTAPGAGNLISANGNSGVLLNGASASNNVLAGNLIGTDASGSARLGNSFAGVRATDAPRNLIGLAAPGGGNVISANGNSGVDLSGFGSIANFVFGNLVGTDLTGRFALGNSHFGVLLNSARTNYIGGAGAGEGNVLAANRQGVRIEFSANGNVVLGNFIGTAADGTAALPNLEHGIDCDQNSHGNRMGGVQPGAGNRIANTALALYDGVRIRDGCTANVVRGNAILNNAELGIDLGVNGPTANDSGDGDAGGNALQNFPVLSSATGRFIQTISGSFNSRPSASFTIDFYANRAADNSGYGEGEVFLGSHIVTTDAAGNVSFTAVFTNAMRSGMFITATATDAGGNTSEFSSAVSAASAPDSDGDGMPDDFELAFGLNPNASSDRDTDSDGDGASNHGEFLAGTRPDDAASAFRLSAGDDGSRRLVWLETQRGGTYRVETSADVTGPWSVLAENLAGTGTRLRVIDPATALRKFYRARVSY